MPVQASNIVMSDEKRERGPSHTPREKETNYAVLVPQPWMAVASQGIKLLGTILRADA